MKKRDFSGQNKTLLLQLVRENIKIDTKVLQTTI